MQIPTNLEDITSDWLTQTLTTSGVIKHTSVTAIKSERIGEGRGFAGQVIRIKLRYDFPEESTPESIIVKISHSDSESRKKISDWGLYKREISFYEQIADLVDMRTPYCYYAALDEKTGKSVILLEDLQNGLMGDVAGGCSREEAELVIEHLASLHAAWWDHPKLESLDWVPVRELLDDSEVNEKWKQVKNKSWARFTEKLTNRIPDLLEETWHLLVQNGDQIRRKSLIPPLTLCHSD